MKAFAKEMWYLMVFAAALITFNTSAGVLFNSWVEWYSGELALKSALILSVIQVALGMLTLKTFSWLVDHAAKVLGTKHVDAAFKKGEEKLLAQRKEVEGRIVDLTEENIRLTNALKLVNQQLAHMINLNQPKAKPNMVEEHFDDWAGQRFVNRMREKMGRKLIKGCAGWYDEQKVTVEQLKRELQSQAHRGEKRFDPVDVANYAMMLWARENHPVECAQAVGQPTRLREKMA
jgi:hypothetical protein